MDIRQLRAGNLVTTNGKPMDTHRGGVYKVVRTIIHKELTTELAVIETTSDNFYDETSVIGANLEPIEITEDLLEKIGFQDRLGIFENKIENYGIEFLLNNKVLPPLSCLHIYDTSNKGKFKLGADVKYLHTLQNLIFDITDLELNVENLITK